jgi:WD40 repeat protein
MRTIHFPEGHITCLKFLSNGNLACSSGDGTVSAWNVESGQHTFKIQQDYTVDFFTQLKDGNLAVSADGNINIWHFPTGSLLRTLAAHRDVITSFLVLNNGDLVSSSGDCTVKIWNPNDGQLRQTIQAHSEYKWCLSLLDDKDHFATGSAKGTKISFIFSLQSL